MSEPPWKLVKVTAKTPAAERHVHMLEDMMNIWLHDNPDKLADLLSHWSVTEPDYRLSPLSALPENPE